MALFKAVFDKLRKGLSRTSEGTDSVIRSLLVGKLSQ